MYLQFNNVYVPILVMFSYGHFVYIAMYINKVIRIVCKLVGFFMCVYIYAVTIC